MFIQLWFLMVILVIFLIIIGYLIWNNKVLYKDYIQYKWWQGLHNWRLYQQATVNQLNAELDMHDSDSLEFKNKKWLVEQRKIDVKSADRIFKYPNETFADPIRINSIFTWAELQEEDIKFINRWYYK